MPVEWLVSERWDEIPLYAAIVLYHARLGELDFNYYQCIDAAKGIIRAAVWIAQCAEALRFLKIGFISACAQRPKRNGCCAPSLATMAAEPG